MKMQFVMELFTWLSGWIVLAESINRLEMINIMRKRCSFKCQIVEWLKMFAWYFMALGAAGSIAAPFTSYSSDLQTFCMMFGLAVYILRTWVKKVDI